MRPLRVSIIGFGSVGQGVAAVLEREARNLKRQHLDIRVVAISDSRGSEVNPDGIDLKAALRRKKEKGTVSIGHGSAIDIIRDVEHELVVETTPTNIETGEPGLTNMLTAFSCGRHVVTSNKGPLALKYRRLVESAEDNGVSFRYEATVGGAVPVFNLIREATAGNRVLRIEGILNGTCNYILTRMAEEGFPYEQILSEAQELGIAEADPTYDVEGIDSACKLAILANAIFDMDVTHRDVEVTGISRITPEALALAAGNDYVVKLIGEVSKDTLRVAPRLVPKRHPLAVGGTLNAFSIHTELAGRITVAGKGAGSVETASAILSDIIHIGRSLEV